MMAKTARDLQKRRLGYILTSCDRIMEHGLILAQAFADVLGLDMTDPDYTDQLKEMMPDHPHAKYALLLQMGMQSALMSRGMFEDFAKHAYGSVPDNVERWTNTGREHTNRERS